MFFGAPPVYQLYPLTASVALSAVPVGLLGVDILELKKAYDLAENSGENILFPAAVDQYVSGLKAGDNNGAIAALSGLSSFVESTKSLHWQNVSRLFNRHQKERGSFSWVTTPALGLPTRSQVLGICRPESLSPQMGKLLDLCDRNALQITRWETRYVLDLQSGNFDSAAEILDQMKRVFSEVIEAVAYEEGESFLMGNILLRFGVLLDRLYQVGERFEEADNVLSGWVSVVFGMEAVAWMKAGSFERSNIAFARAVCHLRGVLLGGDNREFYVFITQEIAELFFSRGKTALLFGKQEIYFQSLVEGLDVLKDLVLTHQSWGETERARNIFTRLLRELDVIEIFRKRGDWEKVSCLARKRIEVIECFSAVEPEEEFALLGEAYTFLGEAALRLGKSLEALEAYLQADWAWKQAQIESKKTGDRDTLLHYQKQSFQVKTTLNQEVFESNTAKRGALISVLLIAHLEEQLVEDSPVLGLLSMAVAEIFNPVFPEIERALVKSGFSMNTIASPGAYLVLQLIDYFELIRPHFSGMLGEWLSAVVGFSAPLLAERRPRFIARLERSHREQLVTYSSDGRPIDFLRSSSAELDALILRWQKQHKVAV